MNENWTAVYVVVAREEGHGDQMLGVFRTKKLAKERVDLADQVAGGRPDHIRIAIYPVPMYENNQDVIDGIMRGDFPDAAPIEVPSKPDPEETIH
ncbi:MAG: hypothetical protein ACYSWU_18230 [Planctomycetota bacterium]|jgi:hypothetical protein